MAGPNYVLDKTFMAEAAITQYAIVIPGTAAGEVDMPGAANVAALGIAQEAAAAGESVRVRMMGLSTCIAQAAIAAGADVRIQGVTGKAETIPATAESQAVGRATSAAAADGDHFEVLVNLSQIKLA